MTDLTSMTIAEAREGLAKKSFTSRELTEAHIAAVEAAHENGLSVVALTGRNGGKMVELLRETDIHICVPAQSTARIQEVHLLSLHCLCDAIDCLLLGVE